MHLSDFAGTWLLRRRIEDRLSGREGRFEGKAVLEPHAQGLTYRETGTLIYGGAPPLQAERSYQWSEHEGRIVVRFADGEPFHDFAASGQAEGTPHLCGADLYRVAYDFGDWPFWRATWKVAGPRKDYTSVSEYGPA